LGVLPSWVPAAVRRGGAGGKTRRKSKKGADMKKAKWLLLAVALGALLLPLVIRAADNPLKNAKVGEWVEFVTHTESMGTKMEMHMKQTVVAKDATSVTLKTESTMNGNKMPPQETKIMLDQPYEPYKQGFADAVVTPLGEGTETITVGGKAYACHWAKVKVVATKPTAIDGTTKVWTCKDVPVSGMVKMENESAMKAGDKIMNTKMTMELVGAGK